jgi:hypothetical protein
MFNASSNNTLKTGNGHLYTTTTRKTSFPCPVLKEALILKQWLDKQLQQEPNERSVSSQCTEMNFTELLCIITFIKKLCQNPFV